MVAFTIGTAENFVYYWSRNLPRHRNSLILSGLRLSAKHIESFRGHEPTVTMLNIQNPYICQEEEDEKLLLTLVCNCSRLLELSLRSRNDFLVDHVYWCCYRPPIFKSLKTLILGFCTVGKRVMALLAAAMEKGSALTEFGISSWNLNDADITGIILGENNLQKFSLPFYDLGVEEAVAFVLAAREPNKWKHLILRPYTPDRNFDVKIFTWGLRVASKSSTKVSLHRFSDPKNISRLMELRRVAFGDRVKF